MNSYFSFFFFLTYFFPLAILFSSKSNIWKGGAILCRDFLLLCLSMPPFTKCFRISLWALQDLNYQSTGLTYHTWVSWGALLLADVPYLSPSGHEFQLKHQHFVKCECHSLVFIEIFNNREMQEITSPWDRRWHKEWHKKLPVLTSVFDFLKRQLLNNC